MMNEVMITATFVTGTTVSDPKEARRACEDLLLKRLKDAGIAGKTSMDGIFTVEIEKVISELLI
jgi:hypothetical protein